MKKDFIFVMSAVLLMTTGMVTAACSSDDDNVITTLRNFRDGPDISPTAFGGRHRHGHL